MAAAKTEIEKLEASLPPFRVNIPTYAWKICPIKSQIIFGRGHIQVKFDEDCPTFIPCLALPLVLKPQLPVKDEVFARPDDWKTADVAEYNARVSTNYEQFGPEVANSLHPIRSYGTTCGSCERGGPAMDDLGKAKKERPSMPMISRKIKARASAAGTKAAGEVRVTGVKASVGPQARNYEYGDKVRIVKTARSAFRGKDGVVRSVDDNSYVHMVVDGRALSIAMRNVERR